MSGPQTNPEASSKQGPQALSVNDLNQQIKSLLESGIGVVWVRGEISNFKPHSSGHYYLSLKDATSQIKAVMFRGHNSRLKFKPKDGMEVLARGQISAYAPRGEYQIYLEAMEPVGAGALQKAFEQLKLKLQAEGLFDKTRKKPLPALPRGIAVVTSPTGAAIRDILNILKRRAPSTPVTVVPTVVQGSQAAPFIIEALEMAYKLKSIDVIILGRGGGSIEDMWCFNDETLARTIARSPVPIISAVGHEIDFTIADFVADLRAPTPSAAAELAAKSYQEINTQLQTLLTRLYSLTEKSLKFKAERVQGLRLRIVDPKKRLRDLLLRQDELVGRLELVAKKTLQAKSQSLEFLNTRLLHGPKLLGPMRREFKSVRARLFQEARSLFERPQYKLATHVALLESLSPLKVLMRGYSYQLGEDGQVIKSAKKVSVGSPLITVMCDGKIHSTVTRLDFTQKEI